MKKETLLHHLKDKSLVYKCYTKSPLRYGGGKSLAVGLISKQIPSDIKRFTSPLIGGGSVEVVVALELDIEVLAFDIFGISVDSWQVLCKDSNILYKKPLKLEPTKENYAKIKNELSLFWNGRYKNPNNKPKIELDPLTPARDYYFNFNLSYGPGFLGWMSKIYEDKNRYLKVLEKTRDFKTQNLKVGMAGFEVVSEEYLNDFFYYDLSYLLKGDSKMSRGTYPMRNFPTHHNNFNHKLLAICPKNHKGKFILSHNDCEFVQEAYKDSKILESKWQYTVGQGEIRMGKNRIERGAIQATPNKATNF